MAFRKFTGWKFIAGWTAIWVVSFIVWLFTDRYNPGIGGWITIVFFFAVPFIIYFGQKWSVDKRIKK